MLRQLKPRILCVDDETAVGELLCALFTDSGDFLFEWETEAQAAVAKARLFKPDLLIIDINMPGLNGYALARQIREEPWLRHRPIIFYSGMAADDVEVWKCANGAPTTFLQKGTPLRLVEEKARSFLAERLILFDAFRALERRGGF